MPINNVPAVRAHLRERLEQLKTDVFERPPSDWAGFQKQLGTYQALLELQAELTPQLNPEDNA